MLRGFAILLIGLGFGGAIGFVLGGTDRNGAQMPVLKHAEHAHVHGDPLVIAPGSGTPDLTIALTPDPVAGWNLNIQTSNFQFAADRAGAAHVDGEGHAHVYVNGTKIARVYGEWHHIEDLPAGPVEVEVVLNSNDHRALVVGDRPLSATVVFDNPG